MDQYEGAGGNFDIRKLFAAKSITAKTIAKISDFPA